MSGAIDITVADLPAVRAAYAQAPGVLHDLMEQAMQVSTATFEAAVIDVTPVGATQILRGSITHEVRGTPLDLRGRVYAQDVPVKVASVEHGRKPGKWPPFGPGSSLYLWVVRKAGHEEASSAAFLIARAIGRRGTKGAHMFQQGFEARRDAVLALWQRLPGELARRLRS